MSRILLAGPIPKRLVSFQFTPTEQIQLIKEMLADRDKPGTARNLGPDDASKFIEILDSVRATSFPLINALRETGSEWTGRIDSTYVRSVPGPSLCMAYAPSEICRDLRSPA